MWSFFSAEGAEPITLQYAKDYLKVDLAVGEAPTEDTLITDLITAARQMIEGRINTSLISRTVEATIINGVGFCQLPYGPVVQLNSITTQDGAAVDAGGYKLIGTSFKQVREMFIDPLVFTYTAGSCPKALQNIILSQIDWLYNNRGSDSAEFSPSVLKSLKNYDRRI